MKFIISKNIFKLSFAFLFLFLIFTFFTLQAEQINKINNVYTLKPDSQDYQKLQSLYKERAEIEYKVNNKDLFTSKEKLQFKLSLINRQIKFLESKLNNKYKHLSLSSTSELNQNAR